jgi:hypothetical protein
MALAVGLGCLVFTAALNAQTWFNLGGGELGLYYLTATNRPSNGLDQLDLYARGDDRQVYVNSQVYSCRNRSGHHICRFFFTHWTPLPGLNALGGPSVVGWGNHREVFAVSNNDQQLWHNWTDGDNAHWSGWNSLGHPPTGVICQGQVDAVSWAPGRMDVFAIGCDRQLWHIWFDPSHGWSSWGKIVSGKVADLGSAASAYSGSILMGIQLYDNQDAATVACNDGVCNDASTWSINDTGSQGLAMVSTIKPGAVASPVFVAPYATFVPGAQQITAWATLDDGRYLSPTAVTGADQQGFAGFAGPVPVGNDNDEFFYFDGTWHIAYQRFGPFGWDTSFGTKTAGSDTVNSVPSAIGGVTPGSAYVFASKIRQNSNPIFFDVVYTYVVN